MRAAEDGKASALRIGRSLNYDLSEKERREHCAYIILEALVNLQTDLTQEAHALKAGNGYRIRGVGSRPVGHSCALPV